METLLTAVETIEAEARILIEDTKTQSLQALNAIKQQEQIVLADVRAQAEQRAAAIMQEHTEKAGQEVNAIRQQGSHAVQVVHEAAAANRPRALKRIHELFAQEYLRS